jgi:adenylate cyclase
VRKRLWAIHAIWISLCVSGYLLSQYSYRWVLPGPVGAALSPSFQRFNGFFRDIKLRYRGYRPATAPVVIVDIDSASLEQFGRWPWRRDFIANLIDQVFADGAKVVGLDMVFSEPQESVPDELREILKHQKLGDLLGVFDFDRTLAGIFAKYRGRLVSSWLSESVCRPGLSTPEQCPVFHPEALAAIPAGFEKFALSDVEILPGFGLDTTPLPTAITSIANLPALNAVANRCGFVNRVLDVDGILRRASPVMLMGGKVYGSLPLQMAQVIRGEGVALTLDARGTVSDMRWSKSGKAIPTSPQGTWDINFLGPERHLRYVSALQVMRHAAGDRSLASLRDTFQGANVLIGVSALAVGDLVATPFEAVNPGVEVQATILENLLTDSLIDTGHGARVFWAILAWMLVLGAVSVYVGQKWEAVPAMAMATVLGVASVFVDFQMLFSAKFDYATGFWYAQLLGTSAITLAGRYIIEQNDKKFVRSAFSKYVPPTVVDNILKDPKQLILGGRRETLTILFSDVRGFTTLSEKLDARTISEFLNDFLGLQTEIVFQYGGTLDKYIGDAVMAFWGAPLAQADHARRACEAAIAIANALELNRPRYLEKYGIHVHMGIGVHTGEVSVGNMGSVRSFSYTVIGDSVNLASRLEGATKTFGVEILTTRATLDSVVQSGAPLPAHRRLAQTRVKGKKNAVEIVELLRTPKPAEGLEVFARGVALYETRQWAQALLCFEKAQALLSAPGIPDFCTMQYIELCRQYQAAEPPADWDSSWSLTSK